MFPIIIKLCPSLVFLFEEGFLTLTSLASLRKAQNRLGQNQLKIAKAKISSEELGLWHMFFVGYGPGWVSVLVWVIILFWF